MADRRSRGDDDEDQTRAERIAAAVEFFRPHSAAQLVERKKTRPPRRWLVKGIIAEGSYGILGAETKSLKTWTAGALAVSVATGEPWLGQLEIGAPGPVLVFYGEGGEDSALARYQAIAAAHGHDFATLPIHIATEMPLFRNSLHMDAIGQILDELRPRLVIVDPAFLAVLGTNLAQSEDVYDSLNRFRALTDRIRAAFLLVHHFNKTGTGNDHGRFSGAGFANWGRFLLSATATDAPAEHPHQTAKDVRFISIGGEGAGTTFAARIRVHSTDPDDLDAPLIYRHDPIEPGVITPSVPKATSGPARCQRALEALDRYATARDVQDWDAEHLPDHGSSPLKLDTVRKALHRLVTEGKVLSTDPPPGAPVRYAHTGIDTPAPTDDARDEPW
jgi:hypothetical protein